MTIWYKVFRYGKAKALQYSDSLHGKLPSPDTLRQSRLHRFFGKGIYRPELWVPTRYSLAMGIAVGWFVGLLPFFGFQIAFSLILCLFLRCHFPTAALGTFITNPITTPAIMILQYGLGRRICRIWDLEAPPLDAQWPLVLHHGVPFAIGAVVSALAMAGLGYLLLWSVWTPKNRSGEESAEAV